MRDEILTVKVLQPSLSIVNVSISDVSPRENGNG